MESTTAQNKLDRQLAKVEKKRSYLIRLSGLQIVLGPPVAVWTLVLAGRLLPELVKPGNARFSQKPREWASVLGLFACAAAACACHTAASSRVAAGSGSFMRG